MGSDGEWRIQRPKFEAMGSIKIQKLKFTSLYLTDPKQQGPTALEGGEPKNRNTVELCNENENEKNTK